MDATVPIQTYILLKVGCLHPVACTRSGSGFPSNATLVWIFYSVTAWRWSKTETCSDYWIKYSKQCCVWRKPWTWYNLLLFTIARFCSYSWLLQTPTVKLHNDRIVNVRNCVWIILTQEQISDTLHYTYAQAIFLIQRVLLEILRPSNISNKTRCIRNIAWV
jgi:hypothetical protein